MSEPKASLRVIRFEGFELDLRSGELRKDGADPVLLPDQSLQILKVLLEHPGAVVNRREIQQRLWPDDTIVEFEHSISAAMNRLRQALGDAAENPKYIETLARRGYRFIAKVEPTTTSDKQAVDTNNENPVGEDSGRVPSDQELSSGRTTLRRIGFLAGAVALTVICVATLRSRPRLPSVVKMVRITNDGKAKNSLNPPVTDGVHLYFTEGMPFTSGAALAQVSTEGGETTWIPTSLQDIWAVSPVSPDHSELLVARGASVGSDDAIELWVQPLPAGAPRRLGSVKALLATWTPDGTHIVYAVGDTIMMVKKDGSEPHQLAKVPGLVFAIRFSPDGQRIRFDLTDPKVGSNSIWEMDTNGENAHPLFQDWKESTFQSAGNWSPDGRYYYFLAGHGEAQAIWVVPERRSIFGTRARKPSRLTSGPLRFGPPVPSGDGKRLFVLGEEARVELLRYNVRDRRFDSYLSGLSAGPMDFSPDRKWMAYVSYPDMTLWKSRVDGSGKIQLTMGPLRAYEPRWSPDGSLIAFLDVRFDSPWKICLLSSAGGNPEVLFQTNSVDGSSNSNYPWEADPTWMPDGKSIVFGRTDKLGKGAIYRLDLTSRSISSIPGSEGLFSPRVSPEGRYISALTLDQKNLMLFDGHTSRWSSLVAGEGVGYNEWSHDGEYVYMRENRGGAGEIVRVRVKNHVLEHILSLKDFPQPSDNFASWVGVTPDDQLLLMRDRSVQEIYALDLNFP